MKIDNVSTVSVDPVMTDNTGVGSVAISQAPAPQVKNDLPTNSLQKVTRSTEEIKKDLDAVNDQLKAMNRSIQFSIDNTTNEVIVKIVDQNTGEVIRQIPPENMVKIRDSLANMTGLIVEKKV